MLNNTQLREVNSAVEVLSHLPMKEPEAKQEMHRLSDELSMLRGMNDAEWNDEVCDHIVDLLHRLAVRLESDKYCLRSTTIRNIVTSFERTRSNA